MKVYIIYDKRTGDILHKHRLVSLEQDDSEDSLECEPEQVLASYRGSRVPKEYLGVAALSDYEPRSSRERVARYDEAKAQIVDRIEGTSSSGGRRSDRKQGAHAGRE